MGGIQPGRTDARTRSWMVLAFCCLATAMAVAGAVSSAIAAGAAGTRSLTIVKDANPSDGTDFDFRVAGPDGQQFVSQFPTSGVQVEVNAVGDVYIADLFADEILVYDSNGTLQNQFGSATLDDPRGLAFDSAGNVYVANSGDETVKKYTSAGVFVTSWSGPSGFAFDNIQDVAVDDNDDVFTIGRDDHRIQKFTSTGTFLARTGSLGTGNGQFQSPHSIDIDSTGDVFVPDVTSQRVQRFSNDLVYETQWGTGTGPWVPYSLTIDPDDNVFVTDLGSTIEVQRFDVDGTFKSTWTTTGPGSTAFGTIQGIAADPIDGSVYVVNFGAMVDKFSHLTATLDDSVPDDTDGIDSSVEFVDPVAGSYEITESEEFGWEIASASCTGGADSGTLVDNVLTVNLGAAEHLVCTFTNEPPPSPGTLTIIKDASPSDGTDFDFSVTASSLGVENFTLDDAVPADADAFDHTNTLIDLAADTYSISESLPVDWLLTSATCTGGSDTGLLVGNTLTVAVALNEDVVCTFTNASTSSQLTIVKQSLPTDGTDFNFSFTTPNLQFGSIFNSVVARDIAAANGLVYITNHPGQINKFQSDGTHLATLGGSGSGNGQFGVSTGVAIEPGGDIWVIDRNVQRVQRLTSTGAYVTQFGSNGTADGQFQEPNFVAVDAAGNVFVTDKFNHNVQKFDSTGAFVGKIGGPTLGHGNGQFFSPSGIAVDSTGDVFVADRGNARVQRLDNNLNFEAAWGTHGSLPGSLNQIWNLDVDSTGDVYVTSFIDHVVKKFDRDGVYITQFASGSGSPFGGLAGLAIDEFDDMYVNDVILAETHKFTKTVGFALDDAQPDDGDSVAGTQVYSSISPGTYEIDETVVSPWVLDSVSCTGGVDPGTITGSKVVIDIAAGESVVCTYVNRKPGSLTIVKSASPADGTDFAFAVGGPEIETEPTFALTFGSSGTTGDGKFSNPTDMAVAPNGDVLVLDRQRFDVQRFDSNGTFLSKFGSLGSGNGQFSAPLGLAVDSAGRIFVADFTQDRVQVFDAAGTYLTSIGSSGAADGQMNGPRAVAIDQFDNLFVLDDINSRVQKFDSSGNFVLKWSGAFSSEHGIAVTESGEVFVTERNHHRVQYFDGAGTLLGTWGTLGTGNGEFNNPRHLAIDRDGNLLIPEVGNARVQRFDVTGEFISTFGSAGSGNGQFQSPEAVAVGPDGSIYVVDSFSDRVSKFAPTTDRFKLDDAAPDDADGIDQSVTYYPLAGTGTYTIEELVPSDWELDSVTCVGGADAGTVVGSALTVSIAANEDIVCTFANTRTAGLTVLSTPCVVYSSQDATAPALIGPMDGQDVFTVQVAGALGGQGGAASCVPVNSTAVVVRVSSIDPLTEGNLRMTPAGVVATGGAGVVNYGGLNGLNNTNTVTIPLPASGAVDVQANAGILGTVPTTDVRLTVIGYYSTSVPPDLKFFPVNPCAVADSRGNKGADDVFDGPLNDGYWSVGDAFPDVDVVGQFPGGQGGKNGVGGVSGITDCGVPASANSVLVNVVSIAPLNGSGHLSVGPSGSDPVDESVTGFAPLSVPMNNGATTIVELNGTEFISLDIDGTPGAKTRVRVEVLGYFDTGSGLSYVPVTPCAAFDSRTNNGRLAAGVFAGERKHGAVHATTYQISGESISVDQGGIVPSAGDPSIGGCGVPDGASAVLINLEAVNALIEGNYWVAAATPGTGAATTGGVLNFNKVTPKMNNSNAVVVPLSSTGAIDLEVNAGSIVAVGTNVTHARGVILGYYN